MILIDQAAINTWDMHVSSCFQAAGIISRHHIARKMVRGYVRVRVSFTVAYQLDLYVSLFHSDDPQEKLVAEADYHWMR